MEQKPAPQPELPEIDDRRISTVSYASVKVILVFLCTKHIFEQYAHNAQYSIKIVSVS